MATSGGTRPAQRGTSSVYHAFRVVASVFRDIILGSVQLAEFTAGIAESVNVGDRHLRLEDMRGGND